MALIYQIVALLALVGIASLAVDYGRVQLDKTALQSTADAASRAACAKLPAGVTAAQNAAVQVAGQNVVEGQPVVLNPATDIFFGTWDPTARTFTPLSGAAAANANAVRVVTARTRAKGNAIPLAFAAMLGKSDCDVLARSTACLSGNTGTSALIGVNGITLSGSALTDSYDSRMGVYPAGSGSKGTISSNGNISVGGSAQVKGDVRYGVGKSGTVTAPASATGLLAPLGAQLTYPSVTLPASGYYDLGDQIMSSGTVSVPGGTYLIHNLNLSATAHIIWTGPVVLYISDSYSVSGSVAIDTYQNLPANRVLNFLPTCTTATWSGSHSCVGELYAPDTDFSIGGSAQLYGRVTAKTLNVTTSGGLHYDEALAPPGGTAPKPTISAVE
jgi:hypothetical protein